jgi:hypothetical protein
MSIGTRVRMLGKKIMDFALKLVHLCVMLGEILMFMPPSLCSFFLLLMLYHSSMSSHNIELHGSFKYLFQVSNSVHMKKYLLLLDIDFLNESKLFWRIRIYISVWNTLLFRKNSLVFIVEICYDIGKKCKYCNLNTT